MLAEDRLYKLFPIGAIRTGLKFKILLKIVGGYENTERNRN